MRFLTALICLMLGTAAASAQNIGIDFARMPVGTALYYDDYEGDTWVETYRGKQGNSYITKVEDRRSTFSSTRRYDMSGHDKKK